MGQRIKLDKRNIEDMLALTPMQQGMLFHYLKQPEGDQYFEQLCLQISGVIDEAAFDRAWDHVVKANGALRTVFRWEKLNKPVQIVLKEYKTRTFKHDLTGEADGAKEKLLKQILDEDRSAGFDLREVAFRVTLCRLESNKYQMIISNHHILYDGWSTGIILKEFFEAYDCMCRNAPLKTLHKNSIKNFITYMQNEDKEKQEQYWREYLRDFSTPTHLVSNLKKARQMPKIKKVQYTIPQDRTQAMNSFARERKITLAALLYSAWGILLQRYTNSGDVVFGMTVSGRNVPVAGIENMAGLFMNTLPLRLANSRDKVSDLMKSINETIASRKEYENTPLVDINKYSGMESSGELFNSIVVIENYPLDKALASKSRRLSVDSYVNISKTNFDLTLGIDTFDGIKLELLYNKALFSRPVIERLCGHFEVILSELINKPEKSVNEINMLTTSETKQLLYDFNDTGADYPKEKTLHQLFQEQVEAAPDKTALVFGDKHLTYGELNARSNQLARRLREQGVKENTIVGIMAERSLEMIIGIMGILKAGGAYLPIDPKYPQGRIGFMLEDSGISLLLTYHNLKDDIETDIQVLDLEDEQLYAGDASDLESISNSGSLAYVIYTSGSTGRPKGVMVEHGSICSSIQWRRNEYKLDDTDSVLQLFSFSFDGFLTSFFTPILSGSRVILLNDDEAKDPIAIKKHIYQDHITHFICVPSLYSAILEAADPKELASLEKVTLAGESLGKNLIKASKEKNSDIEIINEYGPTEGSVVSTIARALDHKSAISIGKPIANRRIYITDSNLNLQPIGVAGELCIGGDGLARGYLNRPELKEEKFTDSPFMPGERIYRTGDLGRWLTDGNIEFIGRIDSQVKLRGHRIELGEIENRLQDYEGIKEAAAAVDGARNGRLCAYIVSDDDIDMLRLKSYLSQELPEYMLPSHIIRLDRLPLTPNGKIDRKLLPEPAGGMDMGVRYEAPVTRLEKDIERIWQEVLETEEAIGINDSFFDLGGHSLNATSLAARIHKVLNVELPLKVIFEEPTIKQLAAYISRAQESSYAEIQPATESTYYPLSSTQKRLYILNQLNKESTNYNMTSAMVIEGPLDRERLEATFNGLIARHESLRTSFHLIDEKPVQKIHKEVAFKIDYGDNILSLDNVLYTEATGEEIEKMIQEFIKPFDLSVAPLIRVSIIKLPHGLADGMGNRQVIPNQQHLLQRPAEQVENQRILPNQQHLLYQPTEQVENHKVLLNQQHLLPHRRADGMENRQILLNQQHLLLVDMHHIISDGVSTGILISNFLKLYDNEQLPALKIQYKDYSVWQQESLKTEAFKRQEEYWLERFKGELPALNLLADYPRPTVQSFEGDDIDFTVSKGLTRKLRALARKTGSTMYMLLLGAYNILLSKYTAQEDIIVGSPIAARRNAELDNVIGMFANTLVMRNYPEGNKTVAGFIQELKANCLQVYENQDYQFEDLVEKLDIKRDTSRNPIFDVMFSMPNVDLEDLKIRGLEIRPYEFQDKTSKFDLLLTVFEIEEELEANLQYCTRLFRRETIERLGGHLINILKAMTEAPEAKISEIDILGKQEKRRLLTAFNNTEAPYPHEHTIHELFEAQVERTPDKVAVVHGERRLTYKELNEKANQLARVLRAKGVGREEMVGMTTGKSLEMVIGFLAILKAGGAYVAIDPEYPEDRVEYMLEDSRVNILLTQSEYISKMAFDGCVINLDDRALYEGDGSNLEKVNRPEDLMYLIYTSGSTGRPKGIMMEHRNFVNLISFEFDKTNIAFGGRVLQFTMISFDVCYQETFSTLLKGGELHIISNDMKRSMEELLEFIEDNQIETVFLPTAYFRFMMTDKSYVDKLSTSIKHIVVAGEQLITTEELKKKLRENKIYLHNHYGPSEAHVVSTYTIDPEGEIETIPPVGRPISNTKFYILSRDGQLQPVGVPGELWIAGDCVGRGYINLPEVTRERFIDNPFNKGGRMYKTGDLVRWLYNGNLEFLGRIDSQVKIRGYRIELGEIEGKLQKHENIKEAVVLVKEADNGDKYLCSYIVPDREMTVGELRSYLSEELPEYMIPSYFVMLQSLPINQNGKLDKGALPEPEDSINTGVEYEAPRDETEEILAALWGEVLGIERTGINDDFFELGGHSLKATILIAKIHKELGVEVPLQEVFKNPNIKGISDYIKKAKSSIYNSIKPAEEREDYPLSSAQKRMYILNRLNEDSTNYNMPSILEIEGALDIERLEDSFRKLIQRHEALRTSFVQKEEGPVQEIHDEVDFKIEYGNNLLFPDNALSSETVENALEEEIENFIRPFDLGKAPLFRARLVKLPHRPADKHHQHLLSDKVENRQVLLNYQHLLHQPAEQVENQQILLNQQHLLLVDIHHIISDGVSVAIMIRELKRLYRGETLEALRIKYRDYAIWQKEAASSEEMKKQEAYWLDKLSGEIPQLDLATDYKRQAIQSFEGGSVRLKADKELTAKLKETAGKSKATLYMVLLAAYNTLLYRYTGKEDIIVGTPIAGRAHADLQNIIGMFVNTLAMRNNPGGEKTFKALLEEVKENALRAYENQDYQFEELVERLEIKRDINRNPLFDTMFTLQNMDVEEIEIEGLKIAPYDNKLETAKFDISVMTEEADEELCFTLQYCTRLFKEDTVRRMGSHYLNILQDIAEAPEKRLKQIKLLSEEEERQLLVDFNDTEAEYPRNKTIHGLFEEQVERTPENTAVVFEDSSLSYRELNQRANSLARELRKKGVKPDAIVAIMVERSLDMIVGIMAILKAGGAYLPIDVDYPGERISFMLQDSATGILITTKSLSGKELDFHNQVICIDEESIYENESENLDNINTPHDLAYIIYTSGTTGRPKGVMIEHNNVVRLMFNDRYLFDFESSDVWTMFHSCCFDFSVWEMYGALLYGGKLVIIPKMKAKDTREFWEILRREKVTVLNQTPAAFYNLIREEMKNAEKQLNIRYVIFGGEALSPGKLKEWQERYQETRLINMYGITETTVHVTFKEIDREDIEANISNIGRPIPTLSTYVMDNDMNLLPIGVPGELLVGGEGVARGYINRAELTRERFVSNPYKPEEILYKSGDLVKLLEKGNMEYLGRKDNQVKIRGYRVELGEIRNKLQGHESISEAAVIAREAEDGGKYLCAYMVAEKEATASELRSYLSKELPDYMIPSYFIYMEKLPLTSNGKVDVKALPEPAGAVNTGVEYEAPRNETEEILAGIWQEVLGIQEGIGINHNFFDLGGHSLKATTLAAKVHKELNVELPLQKIFKGPSIKQMAEYIGKAKSSMYDSIKPVEKAPYYPLSSAQRRMFILNQMAKNSTNYNMPGVLELEGVLDKERFQEAFEKMAARHEALRTSFEMVDGSPVQRIHEAVDFKVEYIKIKDREIKETIESMIRPFDLSKAPLLRVIVGELEENRHLLITDIHHIISDGVSMAVLIEEFSGLYRGEELPELRIQYKDYAVWQQAMLKSPELEKQEKYWLNRFKEKVELLNIPTDYSRPRLQSFEGDSIGFTGDKELTSRLYNIARENKATLYMVLLAAYNALLYKMTGQEDIVVGTPIAGRPHADMQNIIGMFVNTLAMRNNPTGTKSFRGFLLEVKENALGAYENQDYQFEELIDKLKIERELSRNPLFDTMLNLRNVGEIKAELGGLSLRPIENRIESSKFDIKLAAAEKDGVLEFTLEYAAKLFKRSTMERFAVDFIKIIEIVTNNPDIGLSDIDVTSEEEKNRILTDFTDTMEDIF